LQLRNGKTIFFLLPCLKKLIFRLKFYPAPSTLRWLNQGLAVKLEKHKNILCKNWLSSINTSLRSNKSWVSILPLHNLSKKEIFGTEIYFDQRKFGNTDQLVNLLGKIEKVDKQLYIVSVNLVLHSF